MLGAITLATLLRPRSAERVEYECIPYSQSGGVRNNLIGIRNLCVERQAPGLVANDAAAVLTGSLGTVTVAVKPRGWTEVDPIWIFDCFQFMSMNSGGSKEDGYSKKPTFLAWVGWDTATGLLP